MSIERESNAIYRFNPLYCKFLSTDSKKEPKFSAFGERKAKETIRKWDKIKVKALVEGEAKRKNMY